MSQVIGATDLAVVQESRRASKIDVEVLSGSRSRVAAVMLKVVYVSVRVVLA